MNNLNGFVEYESSETSNIAKYLLMISNKLKKRYKFIPQGEFKSCKKFNYKKQKLYKSNELNTPLRYRILRKMNHFDVWMA